MEGEVVVVMLPPTVPLSTPESVAARTFEVVGTEDCVKVPVREAPREPLTLPVLVGSRVSLGVVDCETVGLSVVWAVGLMLEVREVEDVGSTPVAVARGDCEALKDREAAEVAVERREGDTDVEGVREGETLGVMVTVIEAVGEGRNPVLVTDGLDVMEGEFVGVGKADRVVKEVTELDREAFTVAEVAGVSVSPVAVVECVEDPLTVPEGLGALEGEGVLDSVVEGVKEGEGVEDLVELLEVEGKGERLEVKDVNAVGVGGEVMDVRGEGDPLGELEGQAVEEGERVAVEEWRVERVWKDDWEEEWVGVGVVMEVGDRGGVREIVDDTLGEGLCDPLPVPLALAEAQREGEDVDVGHWVVLSVSVPEVEVEPQAVGVMEAVREGECVAELVRSMVLVLGGVGVTDWVVDTEGVALSVVLWVRDTLGEREGEREGVMVPDTLEEGVVELDWDTDWEFVEDPEKEVEEEVVAVKLELFVA